MGIAVKPRPLYVDVVNVGEVINVAACGGADANNLTVEIYRHAPGSLQNFPPPAGTQVLAPTALSTAAGKIACNSTLNAPITNPFRFTPTSTGTYEIRIRDTVSTEGLLNRFDITVTPNSATNPDPRANGGRLWAYIMAFNTGSFAQSASTNADYFIVVPGGFLNTNYVWRLDLNNFAGNVYELVANQLGVDSPNGLGRDVAGLSVDMANNSLTARYKQYLSYPTVVNPPPAPSQVPNISNFRFEDNAGVDYTISPGATNGVQDSGFFKFTTDVDGTYSVVIDVSNGSGGPPDGIYGTGDVLLLGKTKVGVETAVPWAGRDNSGNVLPNGNYTAQIRVRVGEYHFVAADAETSGGGAQNGLTLFQALSNTTSINTNVYWDDITGLGAAAGGTSNVPNGASSSSPAGRHTWGNFTSGGFGNLRYIDTYVYGANNTVEVPAAIAGNDTPVSSSPNMLLVKRITAINGTSFTSVIDGINSPGPNYVAPPRDQDDNHASWPGNFLRGQVTGNIMPGDITEFTIYFLSSGTVSAQNALFCDLVPSNVTFIPNAYNSTAAANGPSPVPGITTDGGDRGIVLGLGTQASTSPYPIQVSLSNSSDGDVGQYVAPGIDLTTIDSRLSGCGSNTNGAIVARLGNLPKANSAGNPPGSYGFVRFQGRVN
ncbi:MAG: hypothetical protein WBA99_01045 [Nodosilinea sp.]